MKIKTSALTGAALDWAVAKCEGIHITFADGTGPTPQRMPSGQWEMYSTSWAQGGPIIEREQIGLVPCVGGHWAAFTGLGEDDVREIRGPTLLFAAMRAFVASKFGDVVEVPDVLAAQEQGGSDGSHPG